MAEKDLRLAKIKEIVDEIPGEDGWNKGGDEHFVRAGLIFADSGMPMSEIENLLTRLYWSVAEEYGA